MQDMDSERDTLDFNNIINALILKIWIKSNFMSKIVQNNMDESMDETILLWLDNVCTQIHLLLCLILYVWNIQRFVF